MKYYKYYNLKNSFNLSCIVNEIYFPEDCMDLSYLILKFPNISIIADGTNIIFQPNIDKLICLRNMPNNINYYNQKNDEVYMKIDSNYKIYDLVQSSIDNNFTGVEGLCGIPGTIGGAIYGNSGSGDCTISDYLLDVAIMNEMGDLEILTKDELNFKRRYSILKDNKFIITNARFIFPNKPFDLEKLNRAKQHRLSLPKYPSVGGIFSNWHELKAYKKKLIGLKVGDAEVSEQINIIVNKGNATYQDIITLIDKIKHIIKTPLILEAQII